MLQNDVCDDASDTKTFCKLDRICLHYHLNSKTYHQTWFNMSKLHITLDRLAMPKVSCVFQFSQVALHGIKSAVNSQPERLSTARQAINGN